jgi:xanthine dehydrogenase accessory factor
VDPLEKLVELRRARTACALCTVVATSGSTPRKPGARMVVTAAGVVAGTIGGGRIENEVVAQAQAILADPDGDISPRLVSRHLTQELGMCCGGSMDVFVEPVIPAPTLLVLGAGHVAQALVPLAAEVGFDVVVADDLPELATVERFPRATRIVDSFDSDAWDVELDARTYAVVVTRDHAQDQKLVEALVGKPLAYLGLIGSRRKVELFGRRLAARGVDEAAYARVHAPIGLDIGAETPSEIAVSICAELIATRAARRAELSRHNQAAKRGS